MSQPSKTYTSVNLNAVASKIQAESQVKIDLSQATGQASGDGVTLSWHIVEAPSGEGASATATHLATVTVTILHKPFFVTEDQVWQHVDPLFG